MTYERALEWTKELIKYGQSIFDEDDLEATEAIAMNIYCAKALEKQIPKTVQLWENPVYHARNYPCPGCSEMLGFDVNKRWTHYCPNCGQALDWSETE